MERLFSPWRSQYIDSFHGKKDDVCVLCAAHQDTDDDERLIVCRGKTCYVIMNLYPYNSGHLMIVPYRHVDSLVALTEPESAEVMSLLQRMTTALQAVSRPDGFNIGSNIGKTAGAGIDKHIHFHIVPRWNGDTNFMPVLADIKLISEEMNVILMKLRAALPGTAGRPIAGKSPRV
jgi:ATP adenylyltransferase